MVSLENLPTRATRPCVAKYPDAWRKRRDAPGCRDQAQVPADVWKVHYSTGDIWSVPPAETDISWS